MITQGPFSCIYGYQVTHAATLAFWWPWVLLVMRWNPHDRAAELNLSFLRWTFTVSLKHPYPEWSYLAVFCYLNFSPLAFYLPSARVINVSPHLAQQQCASDSWMRVGQIVLNNPPGKANLDLFYIQPNIWLYMCYTTHISPWMHTIAGSNTQTLTCMHTVSS